MAFGVAAGGLLLAVGDASSAETTIRVKADEAQIVPLVSTPTTLVVGNPSIADVSIQNGNLLVVMGRNYGTTNIIALNAAGDQIANFELAVTSSGTHEVSLFKGSARASYNCAPLCEAELNVGDDQGQFKVIQEQQTGKMGLANGVTGAEGTNE